MNSWWTPSGGNPNPGPDIHVPSKDTVQVFSQPDTYPRENQPGSGFAINTADIGFDVVLFAGQSNMDGGDTTPPDTSLDPADGRIWTWPGSGTYMSQKIRGLDPLAQHSQPLGVGGPMPIAREYVKSIPLNRSLLMVPCAHSGTGFRTTDLLPLPAGYAAAAGCWDPNGGPVGGTSLYQFAVQQVLAALQVPVPGQNRLTAIFWHQGESDAPLLNQAQYNVLLDSLIDGWRTAFGLPNLPFVLGQMLPEYWPLQANTIAINAAHVAEQQRRFQVAFTYGPKGFPAPNQSLLHYSNAGQRAFGPRYLNALQLAVANVPGTPPATPSGITLVQSGTTNLIVTWTRALARAINFLVEYNTGSGWQTFAHPASADATQTITGLTVEEAVQVRVSAINEQGISAPSIPTNIFMVSVPAQVTGVAATTTAGGSQSLAWNPTPEASTYQVNYRLHGGGAWTTGPLVTTPAAQVLGLLPLTSYDYQVLAINNAGTGPASVTFTNSTVNLNPLLTDVGVGAAHAYSLRLVNPAYAGNCLKVRRSNDNTTANIGFVAGLLDTATMLTFVGANNGFVDTWYDQSGNGNDVNQTSTALQPRIVNTGAVEMQASRPTVNFLGTTYLTRAAASILYAANGATLLSVFTMTGAGNAVILGESGPSGSLSRWLPGIPFGASLDWTIAAENPAGTVVTLLANATGPMPTDGAYHQLSSTDTGTSVTALIDRVARQNGLVYTNARQGVFVSTVLGLGAWAITPTTVNAGFTFTGKIAEVVTFAAILSNTERTNGQANQASFYGTP